MGKFLLSLFRRVGKKNLDSRPPASTSSAAESRQELIRQAVSRTVREYGEDLKRLGSE